MRWQLWRLWWALIATACLLSGGDARAHFLFIRIDPMAEGGRWAEVYFSEQAEAGDPKFVDKIASTQLWVQTATAPGEFQPLAGPQGGRPAEGGAAERGERGGHRRVRVRRAGAAEADAVLAPLLSQGGRGPTRRAEPDAAAERDPAGDPGDDRGRRRSGSSPCGRAGRSPMRSSMRSTPA